MLKSTLISFGFIALFAAVEHAFGLYRRPGVLTMRELGASLVAFGTSFLLRGAVTFAVIFAFRALWPRSEGALAGVSFWFALLIYVFLDEYCGYWLHRKSHEWPWLWRIHKPHHVPQNMNIAVNYRENWIWYLLNSFTWLVPVFVWLGQPTAYMAGFIFKAVISTVVHSDLRWDLHLHRNRFMRPVMRVLERIITLPDVHHAHHGVGRHGNAMKNYGGALSCFDLLHGTLMTPHARQVGFGLPEGAPIEPWAEQLFWPFVRSTSSTKKKATDGGRSTEQTSPAAVPVAAVAVIHTADGRDIVVN